MKHTLYNTHVLDALKRIPDGSVDCIFTSPPYYGLRLYEGANAQWGEWHGQLGLEPSFNLYVDHILMITAELKRVLKKTGTMFWNVGDTYSGKPLGKYNGAGAELTDRDTEGISASGIVDKEASGIPAKSLMMVPERLAMNMVDEQGWIIRNKVIWAKPNGLPSSVKDRFTNKWEYVFFFTKSQKYYFNLDPIRRPLAESTLKEITEGYNGRSLKDYGSAMAQDASATKNRIINSLRKTKINAEDAEMFGSPRARYHREIQAHITNAIMIGRHSSPAGDLQSSYADWYFNKREKKSWHDHENDQEMGFGQQKRGIKTEQLPYPYGSNPGDILNLPTQPHPFAHFAVFPETLVEPFLKAGCPKEGIVLDPFAGSGTVAVVGRRLGLSSISIEISAEYCKIIKERMMWGSSVDDTEWVNE